MFIFTATTDTIQVVLQPRSQRGLLLPQTLTDEPAITEPGCASIYECHRMQIGRPDQGTLAIKRSSHPSAQEVMIAHCESTDSRSLI